MSDGLGDLIWELIWVLIRVFFGGCVRFDTWFLQGFVACLQESVGVSREGVEGFRRKSGIFEFFILLLLLFIYYFLF